MRMASPSSGLATRDGCCPSEPTATRLHTISRMDAASGNLTFLGEMSNGIQRITPKTEGDGVLIAFDSAKDYLTP